MELVKAQLIGNIEADEDSTDKACREAEDIDKGKDLFLTQVADRYFKETPEHKAVFCCWFKYTLFSVCNIYRKAGTLETNR